MREESVLEKYSTFGSDKETEKLKVYFKKYSELVKLNYSTIFKKLTLDEIESLLFYCSYSNRGNERDRFYATETLIYRMCAFVVLEKKNIFSEIIKNISFKAYNKKYNTVTLLLLEFEKRINQISVQYKSHITSVEKYLRLTNLMVKNDELFFTQNNIDYEKIALDKLPLNIYNYFKYQLLIDTNYNIVREGQKLESAFLISGNILDNQDITYKLNSHFRYCLQKGVDFFNIENIPKLKSQSEVLRAVLLTTLITEEKNKLFKKILRDITEFKKSLPD